MSNATLTLASNATLTLASNATLTLASNAIITLVSRRWLTLASYSTTKSLMRAAKIQLLINLNVSINR